MLTTSEANNLKIVRLSDREYQLHDSKDRLRFHIACRTASNKARDQALDEKEATEYPYVTEYVYDNINCVIQTIGYAEPLSNETFVCLQQGRLNVFVAHINGYARDASESQSYRSYDAHNSLSEYKIEKISGLDSLAYAHVSRHTYDSNGNLIHTECVVDGDIQHEYFYTPESLRVESNSVSNNESKTPSNSGAQANLTAPHAINLDHLNTRKKSITPLQNSGVFAGAFSSNDTSSQVHLSEKKDEKDEKQTRENRDVALNQQEIADGHSEVAVTHNTAPGLYK